MKPGYLVAAFVVVLFALPFVIRQNEIETGTGKGDQIQVRSTEVVDSGWTTMCDTLRPVLMADISVRRDEFAGTTYYLPSFADRRPMGSILYVYIEHKDKTPPRIRAHYRWAGERWLFVERAEIKADSVRHLVVAFANEWRRDNDTRVWEYLDRRADRLEYDWLLAAANSEHATLRFYGSQYHSDLDINDELQKSIRDVMTLYRCLGGEVPVPPGV